MKVVIDLPDKYLFRWNDLRQMLNYPDMDSFILGAIGIGVQTIEHTTKIINEDKENVIQFDKSYFWKKS